MQEEFDQLFRACVLEECAWEVLADWVQERMQSDQKLKTEFTCAGEVLTLKVERETRVFDGTEGVWVRFEVEDLGVEQSAYFELSKVANDFPDWIANSVDFVWYVLSK